jgi:hypothetical protein
MLSRCSWCTIYQLWQQIYMKSVSFCIFITREVPWPVMIILSTFRFPVTWANLYGKLVWKSTWPNILLCRLQLAWFLLFRSRSYNFSWFFQFWYDDVHMLPSAFSVLIWQWFCSSSDKLKLNALISFQDQFQVQNLDGFSSIINWATQ